MLLSVHEITKTFGEHVAVDHVSFEIAAAERVALVGPNGAGKSTTLYMVLGLADPDSGSVAINGLDVHTHRAQAMCHLGFAAAYIGLSWPLHIRDIIRYYAGLRGANAEAIERAVQRFGVEHLLDKRARGLSSGQRTLVGVAIATLGEPGLIVLDEPTAYMDPEVAQRVRSGLIDVNREYGSAVLITSHNMTEVERLCDRVMFIANGTIRLSGVPAELTAAHGHETLEDLWLDLASDGS